MSSPDVARLIVGYLTDQGLERTRSVFFQECPDLQHCDFSSRVDDGQKLSLIIEEYFVLKGHDKQSKRDPESVLLLLWKQFDVLVGQLKHSSIHAVKRKTPRMMPTQGVRVRELNRQHRASLQRKKANPVFVPNPHIVKVQNPKIETVSLLEASVLPCQHPVEINNSQEKLDPRLLTTICDLSASSPIQRPNSVGDHVQPVNSSLQQHNSAGNYIQQPNSTVDQFQHVTKSGVFQDNKFIEKVPQLHTSRATSTSGDQLSTSNQLPCSDQFKSPKRKSVQPRRRPVVADGPSKQPVVPGHGPANPVVTVIAQDEIQLDVTGLVEKILGQPEFSEKLAENINRAVELDSPSNQKQPNELTERSHSTETLDTVVGQSIISRDHTSKPGAIVDSTKVENIMEMMKTDPAFEQLFSCFESFASSGEDNELDVNRDEGVANETNRAETTLQNASVATDALLLLASSPAKPVNKPDQPMSSGSLQTPQKDILTTVLSPFSSPVSGSSHLPVLMSPGRIKSPGKRAAQPIFSHVRQLDFNGTVNFATVSDTREKCSEGRISGNNGLSSGKTVDTEDMIIGEIQRPIASCPSMVPISDRTNVTTVHQGESSKLDDSADRVNGSDESKFPNTVICSFQNDKTMAYRRNVVGYKRITQCIQDDGAEKRSEDEDDNEEMGEKKEEDEKKEENIGEEEVGEVEKRGENENKGSSKNIPANESEECSLSVLEELATIAFAQHEDDIINKDKTGADKACLPVDTVEMQGTQRISEDNNRQSAAAVETRCQEQTGSQNSPERQKASSEMSTKLKVPSPPWTSLENNRTKSYDEVEEKRDENLNTEQNFVDPDKPSDPMICKDWKGCLRKNSVKEEPGGSSREMDQRTPSTNVTNASLVPKRKLKKNKRSSGTSKKRRTLPVDLDVDKFLSRLHYVEEKT